jgi:hypothetical protein
MSPTRVKSLLVCLLSFFWLSKGAVHYPVCYALKDLNRHRQLSNG